MICSQMSKFVIYLLSFVISRSMITKTNRNVSNWSMEIGYRKEFIETEYPIRILDSGQNGALELVLSGYTKDHEVICNGIAHGFLFFLSAPGDSLEPQNLLQIDFSGDNLIRIKPTLFTTSKALHSYKPMQRGCFFNSERQLRFFQSYTSYNCFMECMGDFMKRKCGCAIFSMPSTYRLCYDL